MLMLFTSGCRTPCTGRRKEGDVHSRYLFAAVCFTKQNYKMEK